MSTFLSVIAVSACGRRSVVSRETRLGGLSVANERVEMGSRGRPTFWSTLQNEAVVYSSSCLCVGIPSVSLSSDQEVWHPVHSKRERETTEWRSHAMPLGWYSDRRRGRQSGLPGTESRAIGSRKDDFSCLLISWPTANHYLLPSSLLSFACRGDRRFYPLSFLRLCISVTGCCQ